MADERTEERDTEERDTEDREQVEDEHSRFADDVRGDEDYDDDDDDYEEPAPELGELHKDYSIPGVDSQESNPYRWHTGKKRDHGGEDAIEIIDLV